MKKILSIILLSISISGFSQTKAGAVKKTNDWATFFNEFKNAIIIDDEKKLISLSKTKFAFDYPRNMQQAIKNEKSANIFKLIQKTIKELNSNSKDIENISPKKKMLEIAECQTRYEFELINNKWIITFAGEWVD